MQRILCRIAQSQGDFAVKNGKLQVPRCSWYYIQQYLSTKGINCKSLRYTQPQSQLSWGLAYYSWRRVGRIDVIRFDTAKKLKAFRGLFGGTAGYGVRKKRPRYSEGMASLCFNDVLNIISCPLALEDGDTSGEESLFAFQRFGVTDDGIDLAYDASEGLLQVVLCYSKAIVTNDSLSSLACVGVASAANNNSAAHQERNGFNPTPQDNMGHRYVVPGMEFRNGLYIMRIQEVQPDIQQVVAKKVYKVDSATRRTAAINASTEDMLMVFYSNFDDVNKRVKEMLD